jgi:hypothetical protein
VSAAGLPEPELQSQCARALRNLSVNERNKAMIRSIGGVAVLTALATEHSDRIRNQAVRALTNLGELAPAGAPAPAAAGTPGSG